jgi:Fur family zinc uptake transcriptional regulator
MRVLAGSHVPLGAYEIVERLAQDGDSVPPMSVYRVLDFLVAEGLAHRIESRNAFLACGHPHDPDEVVVFFICEGCGLTKEVTSHAVGRDLAWAARAAGFSPRQQVLEIWMELDRLGTQREALQVTSDYRDLYLDRSRTLYDMDMQTDLGDSMTQIADIQWQKARNRFDILLAQARLKALAGSLLKDPEPER